MKEGGAGRKELCMRNSMEQWKGNDKTFSPVLSFPGNKLFGLSETQCHLQNKSTIISLTHLTTGCGLMCVNASLKMLRGTSLVAQWLRIHLPMQGTQVPFLVREDPTCHRVSL